MRVALPLVSIVFMLSACGALLETAYAPPAVALPPAWEAPGDGTALLPPPGGRWWETFGDVVLNRLVERALDGNADLAIAALRVQRARLEAGLAATRMTPDVAVRGEGSVRKQLDAGTPSRRAYDASFALSYELDLWGRLARTRDAAVSQAEATAFDQRAVALALIGSTAASYWTIAELNARIANARADMEDGRRVEVLADSRYRAGATGIAELTLARRNAATRMVAHEQLLQRREAQRKALVTLLGEAMPTEVIAGYVLPEIGVPDIQPGLPASVLVRRPDVAAAQARIRASLALHDAKKASFFPVLSLTGSLGSSSPDLGHVLANPVGSLGAALALPFLQWNTVRLNVAISRTEYEESLAAYRKTLLQAFAEVDAALTMRDSLTREAEQVAVAYAQAERAEAVSAVRYRAGKTNIRFWLDDLQALREARTAVLMLRADRLRAQMSLYQALGGSADAPVDGT